MVREGHRIDFPGAVTATGGLVAVVYGLLQAASHSWGSWQVLLPLLGGVALLVVMVVVEARSPDPLIPMRFLANRTRVTSNVLSMITWAVFIGYIVLLNLYLEQVLRYSPLRTGLLNLPLSVIPAGILLSTRLMPRVGVKAVLTIGYLGSAAGLWICQLHPRRLFLRRRGSARDDRVRGLQRAVLPGPDQRRALSGHRPGLRPGLRGAERHAANRRGARPSRPGHARAPVHPAQGSRRGAAGGRAERRVRTGVPRQCRRMRGRGRIRPGRAGTRELRRCAPPPGERLASPKKGCQGGRSVRAPLPPR